MALAFRNTLHRMSKVFQFDKQWQVEATAMKSPLSLIANRF
jgi:hypothetical protein